MIKIANVIPHGYTETISGEAEPGGSIENIYDGDPTTRGALYAGATASSTSSKTSIIHVFLQLDFTSIPTKANILSADLCVLAYYSRSSTNTKYSVLFGDTFQAFDGTSTSIGSATTSASSSATLKTYTLSSENATTFVRSNDPRLRLRCYTSAYKKSSGSANRTFTNTYYVYEAYVEVTYEISGVIVKTKVSGDWIDGEMKTKVNGEWVNATNAFIKVNGNWEEVK